MRRGPFRPRFSLITIGDDGGVRVAWRGRYLLVGGEHEWRIDARGPDACDVEGRETFEGPAPILWLAARLLRLFRVEPMAVAALEREVAVPRALPPE